MQDLQAKYDGTPQGAQRGKNLETTYIKILQTWEYFYIREVCKKTEEYI